MTKPASRKPAKRRPTGRKALKPGEDGVVRLSGGNPQIAKGEGDAVVQAFIAAMPGWTKAVGQRIDAIVARVAPKTAKGVKWNTPLYGAGDGTWFLAFHVYAKYVKVTFFSGTSLKPVPPESSKMNGVRYLHIREGEFDEGQFADWVKQASRLPGEKM